MPSNSPSARIFRWTSAATTHTAWPDAAGKAGIRIATLWISEALHQNPLDAADPAVRARGVEAIRRAIAIATDMNCEAILNAVRLGNGAKLEYGSQETWDRFSAELAEACPGRGARQGSPEPLKTSATSSF